MDAKTYLAELKSDLTRYDQMGLIDEVSVYTWMEDALKKFGKLVCHRTDTVMDVQKGTACLPPDFYALAEAYRVEPLGYTIPGERKDISDLQGEFAWKERTERGFRWNSCDECCKEEYECVITERFYIKSSERAGEVDFHYHTPRLLNLGKSIKRKACGDLRFDSRNPDTIEMDQTRLFARFDTGSIYMIYWATPRSEDGLPVIFESELGFLHEFVDVYVKRKLFEKMFANGDDPGVVTKLQYFMSQEPILERKAMGELKMSSLSPSAYKRMAEKNRMRLSIYGRMFQKLS